MTDQRDSWRKQFQLRPWLAMTLACLIVAVAIVYALVPIDLRAFAGRRPAGGPVFEEFSLVETGLYLGGLISKPPPKVQAVLNVCEEKDCYQAEFHSWQPIDDGGPAPQMEWLRKQVLFIDEQRKADRVVYVHCRAGINRGPTVTAAYLMWRDGLTRDQAIDALRKKRPQVGPFPVYMDYLNAWEKELAVANK